MLQEFSLEVLEELRVELLDFLEEILGKILLDHFWFELYWNYGWAVTLRGGTREMSLALLGVCFGEISVLWRVSARGLAFRKRRLGVIVIHGDGGMGKKGVDFHRPKGLESFGFRRFLNGRALGGVVRDQVPLSGYHLTSLSELSFCHVSWNFRKFLSRNSPN